MAINTLATNIGRAVSDLKEIREAITDKGVDVPAGTPTSDYDDLIRAIQTGGGDVSPYLDAAIRTVSVTNNGSAINKDCEIFTKEIVSYDGLWLNIGKIEYIDASFEKLVSGVDMFRNNSLREVKTNLNSLKDGAGMFAYNYMFTFEAENNELPALVDGTEMFRNNSEMQSFGIHMPNLENGYLMFNNNMSLNSFSADMPKLQDGTVMFTNCTGLNTFTPEMPMLNKSQSMFKGCSSLESFNGDLPALKEAPSMFQNCTALKSFTGEMPVLNNGFQMFFSCNNLQTVNTYTPFLTSDTLMFYECTSLENLNLDLGALESGDGMFSGCHRLESFTIDMPVLKEGGSMFEKCSSLVHFTSSLEALTNGVSMFKDYDQLSVESLQNIITTLPDRSQATNATLTIGSTNIAKLDIYYIQLAAGKNWTLN